MGDLAGKTVLILGCGYLGRFLARACREEQMRVKAVSRNAEALSAVAELGVSVFQAQLEADAWHGFAGADVDFVVNCVSAGGGGLDGYRQSYLEGNRSLVRWASARGFEGTAIFTSSVSVYPDLGGEWIAEDDAPRPDNDRGRILVEAERALVEGLPGGRAFLLRLGGLYGPGRCLTLDAVRAAPATLPGFGDYPLNLVRIEDSVTAIMACFRAGGSGGAYSIVDDEPSLKSDIVAWLANRLGVAMPAFEGAESGEGAGSRRFGPSGRPASRRISNAKAGRELGWRPAFRSFREGFEDLISGGGADR